MTPTPVLSVRGINYDTGTNYVPGWLSRPDWSESVMDRDLRMISADLHCTAVSVFGSDVRRLIRCAETASALGLEVWVQPRLLDADAGDYLRHLEEVAVGAEALRANGARVRLNVGCELSIFSAGIMPGRGYAVRARRLAWTWPLLPLFNRRLDRLLEQATALARHHFAGEVTYGAGMWETVDWTRFDTVGLNHYRDRSNARTHEAALVTAIGTGLPVLVTEFGCCSYPGAQHRGAAADGVVDFSDPTRPRVVGDHPRDEGVQARYLDEMLDTFERLSLAGAFVFELIEPAYPRSSDPRYDADVASFGLLAVEQGVGPDRGPEQVVVRKEGFDRVAQRYGRGN